MRIVTAAIIEKDGLFLAAKRKKGLHLEGYWELPGGKLEEGELPEECLQRELFEEFGISSEVKQLLGESPFEHNNTPYNLLGYLTKHTGGTFELRDHDEIRWLPVSRLKTLKWAPADIPLVDKLIEEQIYKKNISYYNNHAQEYVDETMTLDMTDIQKKFLTFVPNHGHILDLGCGSGRDSKAFIHQGFQVTAMDASPSIATITSRFLNQEVKILRAEDINTSKQYDGIWASATLLHIPKIAMVPTIAKVAEALKPNGILYFSIKQGAKERWDSKNRFFNDCTSDELWNILNNTDQLYKTEISEETSILRDQPQTWINVFSFKR